MNAHSGLWVLNRNRLGEFHYTVEHKKDKVLKIDSGTGVKKYICTYIDVLKLIL